MVVAFSASTVQPPLVYIVYLRKKKKRTNAGENTSSTEIKQMALPVLRRAHFLYKEWTKRSVLPQFSNHLTNDKDN